MTKPTIDEVRDIRTAQAALQYIYQNVPEARPGVTGTNGERSWSGGPDGVLRSTAQDLRTAIVRTRTNWRRQEATYGTQLEQTLYDARRALRDSLESWVGKHSWTIGACSAMPSLRVEYPYYKSHADYKVTPTHGVVKLMRLRRKLGSPPLYAARRHVLRLESEPTIVMADQYCAAQVTCLVRTKDTDSNGDPQTVIEEGLWWVTSHGQTSIAATKAVAVNGTRRRAETIVMRKIEERFNG